MIVVNMVQVLENGKKLVIKLGHSTSTASDYGEFFSKQVNVNVKKIKHEYDMNIIETVYEIEPQSNNAEIVVTIRDDNPYDMSYHHDFVYFRFNGQKWTSEDKLNPNYH